LSIALPVTMSPVTMSSVTMSSVTMSPVTISTVAHVAWHLSAFRPVVPGDPRIP
jgi:hypothetical protein